MYHQSYYQVDQRQKTLAWHETLELHELVAFQAIGLMKLKKSIGKIKDGNLKTIYRGMIADLEANLGELLAFYPMAPRDIVEDRAESDHAFFAGDLLALMKTAVRNYAIAITETATPELKNMLVNQMQKAIKGHTIIFNYMYERGLYPAYQLDKLLSNDVTLAKNAISMGY